MTKAPISDERNQPPRVEVRIGDGQDEPRHLPFSITAVYERQKPTTEAPYHAEGGKWTYFDCLGGIGPDVAFTVGVSSKGGNGKVPVAWGNAVLIVKDREAGARFVEWFGRSFSEQVPAPVERAHVPRPLSINTAILGESMGRDETGGFSGGGGGWTATKWFLEHDGRDGEVYFNYSLREQRGEFSEKDPGYGDDLVAVFATALRDGSRPERTPDNDPSLTDSGPTIGKPRELLSGFASSWCFSPKSRFAVYQKGATILALPLDHPDGQPFEVISFDHSPWDVRVLDDDLNLVVQEGVPENPRMRSSADPMRLWWVDGKDKTKTLLQGPMKEIDLPDEPASPDRRYVAFGQWRTGPRKEDRTKVLHILDRETGRSVLCMLKARSHEVIGWRNTRAGLRAVAVTNPWKFEEGQASELYLADPRTGELEHQKDEDARLDIDNRLSPDGKHRVRVGEDELIVTDTRDSKQRRFVLHEDDRDSVGQDCIEWASSRYLKFNGPRLALIDVTTMKMCLPAWADRAKLDSHSCRFSPDFRWVLYQAHGIDGQGLFLSPMKTPDGP